jgi:hypothetical protein
MVYKIIYFIIKTKFERIFQTLFYKVLFLISKNLFSNPSSIFDMQARSFCLVYKVLLENLILF